MKAFRKNISVIGLGYIGLPTSITLANAGHQVIGIDKSPEIIEKCENGELHIVEPGLEPYFKKALDSGNLKFSQSYAKSDIFIICVPTPTDINDKNEKVPNISFIQSVAKQIADVIEDDGIVILESTSPVGTTEKVRQIIGERNEGKKIFYAYCPERVLPGNIMKEIVENDRVVGGIDAESAEKVAELYETFVRGSIYKTEANTAELSKLIENSYRDVNIALANQISMYCENKGIDSYDVIDLANKHPRVNIMSPGVGVGGHCIAVDPWFLISDDKTNTTIIRNARDINDYKTVWAYEKVRSEIEGLEKPNIAIFGLAYKPDIDDLRESPSIHLLELLSKDFNVYAVEPNIANHHQIKLLDIEEALSKCNFFVICVPHKEFLTEDFLFKLNSKPHISFCKLK